MARFPSGRLDRFHLLILDVLAYVTKDQAETSGAIRAYRQLRAQVHARHRQPAVRRMVQRLIASSITSQSSRLISRALGREACFRFFQQSVFQEKGPRGFRRRSKSGRKRPGEGSDSGG
jgi:hypothetical protein